MCLFIILLLFLEFLSISFPKNPIDIFHEGQKLSSAYKSLFDRSLWSGSYVTTGIIYENLGPRLVWQFLDYSSIGSMRMLELSYILIFKILLIILIYEISKKFDFNTDLKTTYFLSLILISIFLIDYDLSSGDSLSYRDIPIIIFLIIFFKYLNNLNSFYLPLIFLGMLSVFTFFWSIDRAIIINILITLSSIYFLINKKYYNFIIVTFTSIFFWSVSYFYLGKEFKFFIENTISIFKNINYIYGIIHPTPFSDMQDSSRATKSLLLITLATLVSFNFLFNKSKKYSYRFKIIFITLTVVSFCSYLYALGRSDGGHIKQTTGILLILYFSFILYILLSFIKKYFQKNKFKKNFFLITHLILLFILILSINLNITNITDFKKRVKDYVYLDDSFFLSNEQNQFINETKPIINDYNCLQLFTNDAALSYLLKKPNCSKYYFVYSIGSVKDQNLMIEEIKKVRLIIYTGQTDNWGYLPQKKLPLVDEYITSNFKKVSKFYSWELRFR